MVALVSIYTAGVVVAFACLNTLGQEKYILLRALASWYVVGEALGRLLKANRF